MTGAVTASGLVRRLWHYCNVLRDDGLSYPDYVEQLTYLLFLKMAEEQTRSPIPEEFAWRSLVGRDADAMHRHYSATLGGLGRQGGALGLIFGGARNKISDPAKLRVLVVDLIGRTEWRLLSADVKGDAYEGLLEKNARDTKSGAGQYFTPRPVVDAMVACVRPGPGELVCDPACGTGGFLLSAEEYVRGRGREGEKEEAGGKALVRGVELVPEVARLAAMNLLLHGIVDPDNGEPPISVADSLRTVPDEPVDVVVTNPPFGVKGSTTYLREKPGRGVDGLSVARPDFWVETANKQVNFIQHVVSLLKRGGRAALVLPDNALFESGAAATVRRRLLETCDVHTLLRLPKGLFYAQGVKANVLFFDKKLQPTMPEGRLWVYDLRSDMRFSLKARPIQDSDLADFVMCYAKGRDVARMDEAPNPRWRAFGLAEIWRTAEHRLDIQWRDERPGTGGSLSRVNALAAQVAGDLERALSHISRLRKEE